MSDTAVLTDRAERLAIAARVVSELFLQPPGAELAASFGSPEAADDWPLPHEPTRQLLAHLAGSSPESARALADDHFRLFVGPGRGLACPFESARVSRDGLLFSDETHQVREAYARLGLRAPSPTHLPDDHIGLEFAFVAELAHGVLHGGQAGWEARRVLGEFLVSHLDQFAEAVLSDVETHARTRTYRALPVMARGVLEAARVLGVRHLPVSEIAGPGATSN